MRMFFFLPLDLLSMSLIAFNEHRSQDLPSISQKPMTDNTKMIGTSSTPSYKLPQEEMRTHKPVEAKKEAQVDDSLDAVGH